MKKRITKSIKLTGRITESKSSIKDIKFVERKLRQGMTQAVLIRQAVSLYRRYEEGELYGKEAVESMSSTSNFKEHNEAKESKEETKKERNIDERQAEKLKSSLDMKLKSNSFL